VHFVLHALPPKNYIFISLVCHVSRMSHPSQHSSFDLSDTIWKKPSASSSKGNRNEERGIFAANFVLWYPLHAIFSSKCFMAGDLW
jgi:hypothetical protein